MSAITAERAEIDIPEAAMKPLDASGADDDLGVRSRLGGEGAAPARRRSGLLVTVSAIALVSAVATGLYVFRPHQPQAIQPHQAAAGQVPPIHTSAFAPAASLARAPLPSHVTPLPAVPSSDGDDMAQFLHAGGHDQPSASDIHPNTLAPEAPASSAPEGAISRSSPSASGATTGSQPIAAPVNHSDDLPAPRRVLATNETPKAPPVATTVAATAPTTPPTAADNASHLVAGQMTDAQQIQVLELVTKLGTLVRNQDIKIAELQSSVSGLQGRVGTSLTDFGRRLTLAEAAGAVNGAAATATSFPSPVKATEAVVPSASRVVVHPVAATDTTPHRYHVQAASPGLAMLSELDPSGGEEAQVPVAPGDNLPGYGNVISIAQRGSSWVVRTQHGLIQ